MEHIKDLQEIQIEIKKELGGASLNHLLKWKPLKKRIFPKDFILLNEQKQALNIFAQSEDFQRKLYDAIQIIKNINN